MANLIPGQAAGAIDGHGLALMTYAATHAQRGWTKNRNGAPLGLWLPESISGKRASPAAPGSCSYRSIAELLRKSFLDSRRRWADAMELRDLGFSGSRADLHGQPFVDCWVFCNIAGRIN